ncbi:helix-turn-helix domain-containing protein [Streptomyces sp. NPDC090306]|uniref:helix-turn-helix domain-containing protein n=1 Tax=Streptomyces sp. NPDC090306 TaxID=3365961 RepID=UPI00383039CB
MLEPLGIDAHTEQVYGLLIRESPRTSSEVADGLGCSNDRARRGLDRLVKAGLASVDGGHPARYRAADPRLGLAALHRARLHEVERTAQDVDAYVAEYHERMLRSDTRRLVEVVEGPRAIASRIAELLAGAEREVLAFDAPPYVNADGASDAEQEVLRRGVAVRAVYQSEVLDLPDHADRLRRIVGMGEQARVVPRVPLKMVMVDGRDAVVPLTASEEGTRTTIAQVRRSRLCDALRELFEAYWVQATPVFPTALPGGGGHPDLSEQERALLGLLNAGLKDEAVQRQLGISERTLRRKVADLTARLGATSRFQAGAQAVRREWI